MLLEIEELGIAIPPSRIYEKAAIAALRGPSKHAPSLSSHQDQMMQFTKWLSLIPPAHRSRGPRNFSELRRLIFLAPLTNMLLIIRFAVILASKGYADTISFQAVPLIMRFTPSDVSHQFLKDFEKANEEYWLKYKPSDASHMSRKTSTNVRGTAVRGLAYSGRLSEALALLPVSGDGFRLTSYTYDILLRRLRELKTPGYQKHLRLVQELRGDESSVIHDKNEHTDPVILLADDLSMAAEFGTGPAESPSHSLAETLRSLKHSLVHAENPPHPFVILNFMDTYLTTTGRSRAITLLRNKAMRYSHRSTALFVFSEMLYYRRQGLHDEVIQTFVDHFYLTGIPRDDVLTRYQRIENLREVRASADEKSFRVVAPIPRAWATRGKVWPSVAHCNLVWHSLVALTPDDRALERLYAKLLQFASTGTKDTQPPLSLFSNEIGPLPTPPSWHTKVGSGAFTPFIRRLMYAFGASRGAALLGDMIRLGIKPSVYHFTELAGKYAKWGDAPRAFLILEKMEAGLLRGESKQASTTNSPASSSTDEASPPPSPPGQYNFPLPDIVMYIALIRGFIVSKSLDAAEEVARRMENHPMYSYVPGQDEYLDGIYTDLASLKKS
ncbi:hypothetical protein BD779DRAFT_454258 [Infundibulicybe gibba]|nr:hypothetical protein BD779DRAFT_454258 [Infundibulicybe gibba]